MFHPFDYQEECLRAIRRVRQQGQKRALVVMASGLGKTVTMAFDCLRFRKQHPKSRVLYLCQLNDTIYQSRSTFEAINGNTFSYGIYNGIEKEAHMIDFVFASLQTMRTHTRDFRPDEFDYVIVDESHHTHADTYFDVVNYWQPKFLLGATATPDRTDGKNLRDIFGDEVYYLPLDEALARGLLTPVDYRLLSDEIQLKEVLETPAGRFSIKYLNSKIFVPRRDEEIAKIIKKHKREIVDPRIIIFCQSVAHSEHLAKYIEGSMPIHSRVPYQERCVRLEMFRQGLISTVLAVDVFNEGIDIPQANLIVFLRSTDSGVVFFQQLGRGLRKAHGKEKVIVLDFVANCERIQMVYDLWQTVKVKQEVFAKKRRMGRRIRGRQGFSWPMTLNLDSVMFQEKIMQVIDIIRRKTGGYGYTREECISMLKTFAEQLGRSPTQKEVHENKEMPSLAMYARHFPKFGDALKAAGLVVNQILDVSNKDLLEQLKGLVKELGHPPSQREVGEASKAGKCSSEPVFRQVFGSLSKALERIGSNPSRYVGLGKTQLCAQLRKLRKKLGRVPTVNDLITASAADEIASFSVFRNRFKSWPKALKAAGIKNNAKETPRYKERALLADLRTARRILGHPPTVGDVLRLIKKGKLKVGSVQPFYSRFKTWKKTLEAAGIK